jgi:hypothetical protein
MALYKMPVTTEDGRGIAACKGFAYRTEDMLQHKTWDGPEAI